MKPPIYVWAIVTSYGSPPTGSLLHDGRKDYHFYPFQHEGEILTIDVGVWNSVRGSAGRLAQWPAQEQLEFELSDQPEWDWKLIAASTSAEASTGDRSTKVHLQPLVTIPDGFRRAGFDVIDRAGLSALVNIGFSEVEVVEIARLAVSMTSHGLIRDFKQAERFARLVSRLAIEHAPFFPIEIWVRDSKS